MKSIYNHKTAEGRNNIYLRLAKAFFNAHKNKVKEIGFIMGNRGGLYPSSPFICDHLGRAAHTHHSQSTNHFPEFAMFEPVHPQDGFHPHEWWDTDDKASRVFALLFSAEFTRDKDFQKEISSGHFHTICAIIHSRH